MESQSLLRNARPWASLAPDLLLDITGRLHDATDFVRFHAVCQPWRDTATRSQVAPGRRTFLPWLLSRYNGRIMHSPVIYFGRVSSEPTQSDRHRSYNSVLLAEPGADGGDRNWVAREDGGAASLFFAGFEPTLLDVVTRVVTYLPRFPDLAGGMIKRQMRNPRGILCCDGTVFLYSFVAGSTHRYDSRPPVFTAAILRPGDLKWTVVVKMLDLSASHHSCAAYYRGKVLVWVGAYFWCVLTPDFRGNVSNTANIRLETTWDRLEDELYVRDHSYIFVSRGELLRVTVLIERQQRGDDNVSDYAAPTLVATVHVLERQGNGGKMQWVERDESSMDDRALFLGSPASFAMDATQLDLDGGCAYFTFGRRVLRYSFFDGEAKPVDWLFPGWDSDKACVWPRPQPEVVSIMGIRNKLKQGNP